MSKILRAQLKFEKPILIDTSVDRLASLLYIHCGVIIVKFASLFFNVCYPLHAPGWAPTNKYTPLHGY